MKETVIIRDEGMRERVVQHIAGLNISKPWAITIEPYKGRRTLSQNALMWKWIEAVVMHIHEATGQDKEDVHEWLKTQFLPAKVIEIDGRVVFRYSTKGLTTAEMSKYMDKIYAWATTELGLLLPVPEGLGSITTGRATEARR